MLSEMIRMCFYLNNAFIVLVQQGAYSEWDDITMVLSAMGLTASLVSFNLVGAVISATSFIISAILYPRGGMLESVWVDISTTAAANARGDPSYGFQLFQRFHWVAGYCWYDPMTWTTFHTIYYNGIVLQICPSSGVCYMYGDTVGVYVSFLTWYNSNLGFFRWVWVSNPFG